jgi:hypothetical protein
MYKTIFPVVLYGRETKSLTLRGEHKLQMSENKVLRKVSEPKTDEASRYFRILHNEELGNLYRSRGIVTIVKYGTLRWAKHVDRMGDIQNICDKR